MIGSRQRVDLYSSVSRSSLITTGNFFFENNMVLTQDYKGQEAKAKQIPFLHLVCIGIYIIAMLYICLYIALSIMVQHHTEDWTFDDQPGSCAETLQALQIATTATEDSGEGWLSPALAFSEEKCATYILTGAHPEPSGVATATHPQWSQSQYLFQGSFGFQEDEDGIERNTHHGGECHQPA